MKYFAIIALIVAASAFRMEHKSAQKHIEELHKTKWGNTLLNMMSLHAMSQGPVDELITAIDELIEDLTAELEQLNSDFNQRTNENHKINTELGIDISDAVLDYQRSMDTIDNLLKPRRDQLKNKIANIVEFQEGNRKNKDEAIHKRGLEHEEFEAQVEEYASAIEATDSALNLMASLSNPSLVQIRNFHVSLKVIEQSIPTHSKQSPMIKALIALANEQNFADQGVLGQIVHMLNEFRNAIVDATNALTAQEAVNQQEFEERVAQLDHEHDEFGKQITRITIDLTATVDKINELTEFASMRDEDRKRFQQQLDLENATYAEESQIYADLKNQYIKELGVAESAQGLVKSADFTNISI